ncbi:hypothetical protein [Desulfosporosinus sp. FKA]|uniref:hypothetical protein n=1 Tax=Desulfosporosinus sp. FKA TaxID=1969834 RepID=UPI001554C549|nr:hypothetical protein [Desulfosporosinus sp. FKA]
MAIFNQEFQEILEKSIETPIDRNDAINLFQETEDEVKADRILILVWWVGIQAITQLHS